jgi:acyl-CoA synthetase (AMP-forming)/AMP-acid ligase II
MIIDADYMCKQVRDDSKALYIHEDGKTCPTEILERLAEYKIPSRIIIYDELPMTANGKIDAKLLKEQVKER